jgi:hypothetical protein
MTNYRTRTMTLALTCGFGAFLCFQNCARTGLETPQLASTLNASGETSWCLQDDLNGYTVESFYVRNVNVVPWLGNLVADSDADGLPDSVEKQVGFDPQNPRSRSGALDRVCYNLGDNGNSCPMVAATCDPTPNALGMAPCDIQTLQLDQVYQHPTQGLDTDKDGIPDYIEILAGTDPKVIDNDQDPDHDEILNQDEIARGSNPFFADADLPTSLLTKANSQHLTGAAASNCSGELWQFEVDHIQYVPTLAISSNAPGPLQSHNANENIILMVIKLRPNSGVSGNAKLYYQTFIVDSLSTTLPLDSSQLQLAGEVLP